MPNSFEREDLPFLTAAPPPWAVRALAWFLIAIFATAAVASVIVRVPETVVGRFVLVPMRGTDPVRFFFHGPATTEIYTLSLHDALPISSRQRTPPRPGDGRADDGDLRPAAGALGRRQSDRRGRICHDRGALRGSRAGADDGGGVALARSEEHTSELQSPDHLVCRLLLEK